MIERIYILCLVIIIKSEVWTITHCLGLGHATIVCAVCLSVFLWTVKVKRNQWNIEISISIIEKITKVVSAKVYIRSWRLVCKTATYTCSFCPNISFSWIISWLGTDAASGGPIGKIEFQLYLMCKCEWKLFWKLSSRASPLPNSNTNLFSLLAYVRLQHFRF